MRGPCAEGSAISLPQCLLKGKRPGHRVHLFTPANCTLGAPCSRQESRGGQWPKACAGRLQLDTGQEHGERGNLRPRRHCGRCSRMPQRDPEERGWASGAPCWALRLHSLAEDTCVRAGDFLQPGVQGQVARDPSLGKELRASGGSSLCPEPWGRPRCETAPGLRPKSQIRKSRVWWEVKEDLVWDPR